MTMPTDPNGFLLLLNWMSPTFPTGAFAYSHGLEWAISSGDVATSDQVESWIADVLQSGSGWNDAVLFAQCWTQDTETLNQLALALAASHERHLETTHLGRAFTIAARSFFPETPLPTHDIAYPIAAGTALAKAGIDQSQALLAFLQGFTSALISVAVRLVPLGQTKGLEVVRNLLPIVAATAQRAIKATLDELGTNTILADVAAMKHETQHSRIFRT